MRLNAALYLIVIVIIAAQSAQGHAMDSNAISTTKAFKCQPVTIYANFSDFAGITNVDVMINNSVKVMINGTQTDSRETFTMTNNGGGRYSYTYGNDATIIWGIKELAFDVTDGGIKSVNTSNLTFLIYSDTCTGVDLAGYQNLSRGMGNYTARFYSGESGIIEFFMNPWLNAWGYLFYIIIIFWIAILVYMKNQQIIQPLIIICVSLGTLTATTWLPPEFKQYIIMILGLALGGMFYKVFKA